MRCLPKLVAIAVAFFLTIALETFANGADSRFVRVSERNPEYFELSDGTPWIPIGVNLCLLREYNDELTSYRRIDDADEGLRKIEFYFQKISENGGNYARIWLSDEFFEIERERPGLYDEERLRRLEETLKLAEKYDIRLKLCFEHFRQIGPRDDSLFTKSVYYTNPPSSIREFVESTIGEAYFLNRCRAFADRFKDNPRVFAWEIWNEVNCIPDGLGWTKKTLGPVRRMFPNNLVVQSLGSLDSKGGLAGYRPVWLLAENDVAQVHRYLDQGVSLEVCRGPMDRLASDMVKSVRAVVPGKPILATEMGAVEKNHTGPSKLYLADKEGVLLHDILFAPFFSGAAGSGHCWHWNSYIEKNDLWKHIGRFSKAIEGVDPIREKFVPFERAESFYVEYGLRGETTTLLWIRSQEDNWKTELVDGVAPKVYERVEIELPNENGRTIEKVVGYDPWEDVEFALENRDGKIVVPRLKRSVVVKIYFASNR